MMAGIAEELVEESVVPSGGPCGVARIASPYYILKGGGTIPLASADMARKAIERWT